MIDAYVMQWKSGSESYGTARQALVTDLSDLSHTISRLTPGTKYTIRVAAVNQAAGVGLITDDDGHKPSRGDHRNGGLEMSTP